MGVVVGFDYNAWTTQFPEFVNVDAGTASLYFTMATNFHRNDGGGPVSGAPIQSMLLNLVTAHIASLFAPRDQNGNPNTLNPTQPASALVGRIKNASEGSVSVDAEYVGTVKNDLAAWYLQTKYGAMYWSAIAIYRTFRYHVPPRRNFAPWPFVGVGGNLWPW